MSMMNKTITFYLQGFKRLKTQILNKLTKDLHQITQSNFKISIDNWSKLVITMNIWVRVGYKVQEQYLT